MLFISVVIAIVAMASVYFAIHFPIIRLPRFCAPLDAVRRRLMRNDAPAHFHSVLRRHSSCSPRAYAMNLNHIYIVIFWFLPLSIVAILPIVPATEKQMI